MKNKIRNLSAEEERILQGKRPGEVELPPGDGREDAINDAARRQSAEHHRCADCSREGFGGWNCTHCGSHNLVMIG